MKTGVASVPGDWALLCDENDLCLKPTKNHNRLKYSTINHSLCRQNCWRIGEPVFHTAKATHSFYRNNGLEVRAFETELHVTTVTEEDYAWFSSQGVLSIDHNFDFLKVHLCVLLRVPASGLMSSATDSGLFLIPFFSMSALR